MIKKNREIYEEISRKEKTKETNYKRKKNRLKE